MNRPSRNDDAELEHPGWNQSPPFLAPDLTTRQDLNGMANARVYRNGAAPGAAANGLSPLDQTSSLAGLESRPHQPRSPSPLPGPRPRAGAPCTRQPWSTLDPTPCMSLKTDVGGEGHVRLALPEAARASAPASSSSSVWGWVTWVLSVLASSLFLSWLSGGLSLSRFGLSSSGSNVSLPSGKKANCCPFWLRRL